MNLLRYIRDGYRWLVDPYGLLDDALRTGGLTFRIRLPVLGDVLMTGVAGAALAAAPIIATMLRRPIAVVAFALTVALVGQTSLLVFVFAAGVGIAIGLAIGWLSALVRRLCRRTERPWKRFCTMGTRADWLRRMVTGCSIWYSNR